ncbi:FixH family protein [Sporosarcina sp. JAI121]|uniref:FixH family protein n=1 Tax=Sporosarcina sp. JAI121 TaxID=2723064 RepID=UPI0015CAC35B|nr:FixH family protein [Sporosarcina sp. JAI121]NYF25315.1 hypothetical protein [Sporosarcina sp. JAI121]
MKRKSGLFFMILVLTMLAACGKEQPAKENIGEVPLPLDVELTVPEQVEVGGKVEMAAVVTQGEEKIEDADEVEFEIWEEGKKDDSIKVASINEKDGLYTAETTFDHDGLFHIQVHVTARSLHTMPKKEVTVGEGGNYEEAVEEEQEHAHADGFSMDFLKPENAEAGESLELVVKLKVDGQSFEKAQVRYEIWNVSTPDKHDWIDAEELAAGEYTAPYTFAQAESYNIQIHVKDDKDLHEHEEYTVEVK